MDAKLSILCRSLCIAAACGSTAPAAAFATTDPIMSSQWALTDPSAMGAAEAWTQSTGSGVLVAVLDTGVQLDHPDLAGSIWTNTGEIAGNGRDDDADGFVDDVHGANMFDSTSANVNDDNGHGTHVAGIVAARKDNGIGGSGIAPGATVLPVKVLDANMAGSTDTLARGIRYAVDRGAKILNVSVNSDTQTPAVRDAVRYAGNHGAVVVASSGNNGRNIDLLGSYPASLTDPAVISVGALDSSGHLWNKSNTGLLAVDLAAPGVQIASSAAGSSYQSRTGTSAAAPFVAGSLALLSAARPDLSMSVLKAAVLDTTRRQDFLAALIGGGRLDVGAAMHKVLEGRPWRTAPLEEAAAIKPVLKLRTKSKVRAGTRVTLRWVAKQADAVAKWRVSLDRRVAATVPATVAGVSRRIAKVGRHTWSVVGLDANGAKVVGTKRAFRAVRKG